ncbi:MAG: hypothetical protein LBF15_01785 [Candidatus Peribacteria bacterium]|jgi:hypothetical protein|nr:hypothetical protein [Candidatus Peribacteria bacterium]
MTKEKNLNEEIHELEEKGMRSFFDHIEFLEFNDNEKEAVAADITESSK